MRVSEAWLREFVDPTIDTRNLTTRLTAAGLEVGAMESAGGTFAGVVVAEVLSVTPHPQADRLKVCQVNSGGEPLQIVCGAPNVRAGLRVPLALEGALLPGGLAIKRTELRGITSCGMLCSGKELGIDDPQSGLMELAQDAPVGTDFAAYLNLPDTVIEVDLTPNRADCLSMAGIAREVAVLTGTPLKLPTTAPAPVVDTASLAVELVTPEACPIYLGRVISGVSRDARTPTWMKERLRRAGIRSLDPVVDVTNYVLLELGQPLHAFDADKLQGGIQVRYARTGETLRMLNDQVATLDADNLVIADDSGPVALAGIMGGSESAVDESTQRIFLECAFFAPTAIMGRARRHGLATESSQRFERGVDPELQAHAIERATALILQIAGGVAGPVTEARSADHVPKASVIHLRQQRITRLLGIEIGAERTASILNCLGFTLEPTSDGWNVKPPSFRFDISLEADLIEEVARIHGYESLPRRHPIMPAVMLPMPEGMLTTDRLKDLWVDRGYQEAITYSFVDAALQAMIEPDLSPIALKNPMSAELAVMRTSLWPGLLDAALKNLNRQHSRVRLFESGLRFNGSLSNLAQTNTFAVLATGSTSKEQWGDSARNADFFDLKGDIEAILALTGRSDDVRFSRGHHPALHPGQTALIELSGTTIGHLGLLHPSLEKKLGFEQRVLLCQFDLDALLIRRIPKFAPLSKFPQVRRDLALVVRDDVPVGQLLTRIRAARIDALRDVWVFDVYRGTGIEPGQKSVALGLIFQNDRETLVDEQVDTAVNTIIAGLTTECGARLRE